MVDTISKGTDSTPIDSEPTTNAAAEYLRELYHGRGLTLRDLGDFFEVSPTTVRRWLEKAGVELRGTGPRGSFGRKLTADSVRAIRAALADGRRQADLAREFGVSRQVIHAIKSGKIWKETEVASPEKE